ncbi:hypothetical protein GCM10027562_13690 [Arthrobacter pigmenti]
MFKYGQSVRFGRYIPAAALILLLLAAGVVFFQWPDDNAQSHSKPKAANTEYGFTVSFLPVDDSTNKLAGFKRDVDALVRNDQEWIRFGITGWEVVADWGDAKSMEWNEDALRGYEEAIDYARSKGLSVYLVTADGHMGLDASSAEYRAMMDEYWSVLADRFADDAAVWQLYNEVDAGHYSRSTGFNGRLSEGYLSGLETMLGIGRDAIKSANPDTLVTTNTMGWPMSNDTEQRWVRFFDAIESTLDVIAIDVYPVHYTGEIAKLDARVERMKERYDKPVIVAELGLQTCQECWSEEDQGTYVAAAVQSLAQADPMAVIVYEFRDEKGDTGFGVLRSDWSGKSGFDSIIASMRGG